MLAPRGCLINYGELSGPAPGINPHELFPGLLFVTKFNGMHWTEGIHEFASLVADGLKLATTRPAIVSNVAASFTPDQAADAYRQLELGPSGKILVLPAR